MKIQHKITIGSTLLFGVVFLITSVATYWAFDKSSKNIFYSELSRTAEITAMFYLEEDELTKSQYQPIADAFYNLSSNQLISIYNKDDSTAFDTGKNKSETVLPLLDEIRQKGIMNFKKGNYYYHGLFYEDNQGDFVILVNAQNSLIQSQLNKLLLILVLSFIAGMIVLIALTSYFSKLAYRPVRDTIRQVNKLDLNQKELMLDYKTTGDELEELFVAFNALLKEIEETYNQQKNFVNYASHEFKTPLANIINQSEVNLQKDRSMSEYKETIRVVLTEAERLQRILKNLLTFSNLNRAVHQKESYRIDELVWELIELLNRQYPETIFNVALNVPTEDLELLNISGNAALMSMALFNFMENAAKFSNGQAVNIVFENNDGQLRVIIKDCGIGIPKKDLKDILHPFYRSDNAYSYEGSGLGMSIALKVLKLSQVQFAMESEQGKGTTVVLNFLKPIN